MLLRRARYRCAVRLARPNAWLGGLTLAVALAGCGAVETWRSVSGVNKNDPDPETAPFTQNLAAGEAIPYPHLATLPPPPTSATSTPQRQKLTQTPIAERTATPAHGAVLPARAPPNRRRGEGARGPESAA